MADLYRRFLDKKTGAGGVKCECCNWTKDADSNNGHRLARIKLKKMIRQLLKKDTIDRIER
jgi:hypothetical protein